MFSDAGNPEAVNETMIAEHPEDVLGVENLRVAPEIEWPLSNSVEPTMTEYGRDSNPALNHLQEYYGDRIDPGGWTTSVSVDSTVGSYGLELQPRDILTGIDAEQWFSDTLQFVEEETGFGYEPVGLMRQGDGSTAGLHIHISPLSRPMAEELWEMSLEPWMHVFTGSSIADDPLNARVFRGGQYCQLDQFDHHRAAVRERGQYHYEWRLPEPMTSTHFHQLIRMLDVWLAEGRAEAREYALDRIREDDSDVTAVVRAEAVGLRDNLMESIDVSMSRTPHPQTVEFYDTVRMLDGAPYAFRAVLPDGDYYYFHSFENADLEATVDDFGITVEHGTVLDAQTLDRVDELGDRLEHTLDNVGENDPFNPNEESNTIQTEATDFLLETAFGE